MTHQETVVIIDFGSRWTLQIIRTVRELQVYAQVIPYTAGLDALRALKPSAVILSGSPAYVNDEGSPSFASGVFDLGIPVLGICYGMQLTAHLLGGRVEQAAKPEDTAVPVAFNDGEPLFEGLGQSGLLRMAHRDNVARMPYGFTRIAATDDCPIAAMKDDKRQIYGVQFHPEADDLADGKRVLRNFLRGICCLKHDWCIQDYAEDAVQAIQNTVGEQERVLLALSGGVDSAVCAALLDRAIGDRLVCVFVDHGFMRKGEPDQVSDVFSRQFTSKLVRVDASDRFFSRLSGVTDPECKRKIIGAEFIDVFKEEAQKLGTFDHFAQGTIYPDIMESVSLTGGAPIKAHHNVGGLPEALGFSGLIEPLRMLFKDEVRALGTALGLPEQMVRRQPFPGPGLAVRTLGELTREKVAITRESDAILREEFTKCGLHETLSQYFTVLTNIQSVGVKQRGRTYAYTVAVRAVVTDDFTQAAAAPIPFDILARLSARITSECDWVNRVVYDITSKPPATIEWE